MIFAGVDFGDHALVIIQRNAVDAIRMYCERLNRHLIAYEVAPHTYLEGATCHACGGEFQNPHAPGTDFVLEFAPAGEAIYHLHCKPDYPWFWDALHVFDNKKGKDGEQAKQLKFW